MEVTLSIGSASSTILPSLSTSAFPPAEPRIYRPFSPNNLINQSISASIAMDNSSAAALSNLSGGTLVNVTSDWPIEYAVVLFGYLMPIILIITVLSNSLVVVVLSQRHMRTSTNVVLLAMAISDLLTLLFPAPWYIYLYTFGNHVKILKPTEICYAFHCMNEIIPMFFHTASIWLTLVLATQRYIFVCHPIAARNWCTLSRVVKSMVAVFGLSLLAQVSRFFDRSFKTVEFEFNGRNQTGCVSYTPDWLRSKQIQNIYFSSYYTFRILFVHLGPCTALVVLNMYLFRALKRAETRRQEKLFKDQRCKSECKKMRDSNCTTLMLIVVVTVFLITEIPLAVTTILHVVSNLFNLHMVDYKILNLTILFTNFIITASYPLNFAIYCGMSRKFRETFKHLFCGKGGDPGGGTGGGNGTTGIGGGVSGRRDGSAKYSVANGPRTSTNETVL